MINRRTNVGDKMRVTQVEIKNFRSITHSRIDLRDVSLIAGANNAGKSNVIDAVRMFYGDIKWSDGRDQPKFEVDDDESWVELEFSPSSEETEQLAEKYRTEAGTFRVRNYIKPSKGPDGKARAGYYAYVDGAISETLFYGAKNVASGKIGKIVYIPAVSKIDDHTKLTGPSALRDLVANVLDKVIVGSTHYKTLTTAFTAFETGIKAQESSEGQSLRGLEEEIATELETWNAGFSLEIQNVQPEDLIKSLIKPKLVDLFHGEEIDQARFGAGFQRNLIYLLIKLAAKYTISAARPAADKKEFAPQLTWILFEEPEAFLHPSQEDILFDSLLALVVDPATQVLITTHSARFVSRSLDDLTRLIKLRRDAAVTGSHQLSQAKLDAFFDSSLAADAAISTTQDADIDRVAAMAAMKMELWLHPQRSAAFFATTTLLVEGPSEVSVHTYLARNGHLAGGGKDVVVVDCMGKWNLHRFMNLMNAFGVDHAVLYDGDKGSETDIKVQKTIEDAKGEYTKSVHRFASDLEGALGVPKVTGGSSHKKPQHLLYHLQAGLVDKEKIVEVSTIFESLTAATSVTSPDETITDLISVAVVGSTNGTAETANPSCDLTAVSG